MRFPFPWSARRVTLYAVLWVVGTSTLALAVTVRNIEALAQSEQLVGVSLFMETWPSWVAGLVCGPPLFVVGWRPLRPPTAGR